MPLGDKIFDATVGFARIKAKIVLGIIIFVAALLIILGTVTFFKKETKTKRSTATVVRFEGEGMPPTDELVNYYLQVPELNAFLVLKMKGKKLNDQVEVIYNPDNILEVELYDSNKYSNRTAGGIMCAIAIVIVVFYYIIYYFTQKSEGFAAFQGVNDVVGMFRR